MSKEWRILETYLLKNEKISLEEELNKKIDELHEKMRGKILSKEEAEKLKERFQELSLKVMLLSLSDKVWKENKE